MFPELYSIVMSPLLRALFKLLGTGTGIWIRFDKVHGEFFQYQAEFENVKLEIPNQISCSLQKVRLEFSILDMSLDTLVVSNVCLQGAKFEYHHVPNRHLVPRSLPPFLIKNLQIKDAEVVFSDQHQGSPYAFHYYLDEYQSAFVRSQSLLFNVIFGAQVLGQIDQQAPFSMKYHEEGKKCISQWVIKELPMNRLTPFVNGKLNLLENSKMNLLVTTEWFLDSDEVTLNLQGLIVDLVSFDRSSLIPPGAQVMVDLVSVLVNQQVREIPIRLQFKLRKDEFLNLKDINTVRLMTAFAEALSKALLEQGIQNYSQWRELGLLGLDTFKDLKRLFEH